MIKLKTVTVTGDWGEDFESTQKPFKKMNCQCGAEMEVPDKTVSIDDCPECTGRDVVSCRADFDKN